MTAAEVDRVVTGLIEVVPDELYRRFAISDLCVLATRIGYDACRYFGLDARPLVVRAVAFNVLWFEHYQAVPDLDDPSWADAMAAGAYSVAVGDTTDVEHRFPGHLVLAVDGADGGLLVDLATRQFSRPPRMRFPDAVAVDVDHDRFRTGAEPALFAYPAGSGFLLYTPRPDAPDYRRSSRTDWNTSQPFSGAVIRRLKTWTLAP